jgi:hypothetical protein
MLWRALATMTTIVAFVVCSRIAAWRSSASTIVSGSGPSSRIDPART